MQSTQEVLIDNQNKVYKTVILFSQTATTKYKALFLNKNRTRKFIQSPCSLRIVYTQTHTHSQSEHGGSGNYFCLLINRVSICFSLSLILSSLRVAIKRKGSAFLTRLRLYIPSGAAPNLLFHIYYILFIIKKNISKNLVCNH